jgi:hypothetical protein
VLSIIEATTGAGFREIKALGAIRRIFHTWLQRFMAFDQPS